MTDHTTTVAQLRQLVEDFVAEREWHAFHTPKNLVMSLAIETAELMEHFQWLTPEQSRAITNDNAKLAEVGEEIADVFCYGLAMVNTLGIDLATTIAAKIEKNKRKYPAAEYRGRFGPDDPNGA